MNALNHRAFAWLCHDLFFGTITEGQFTEKATALGFTVVDAAEEVCRLRYSGENGENPTSETLDELVDAYLAEAVAESVHELEAM